MEQNGRYIRVVQKNSIFKYQVPHSSLYTLLLKVYTLAKGEIYAIKLSTVASIIKNFYKKIIRLFMESTMYSLELYGMWFDSKLKYKISIQNFEKF